MHKELASEPSWKPTELASEAALAIDMAVRVAAREIGRLDLSPQAWAAMLGEAAIAIAEGAAACAPGQSEGRVDRAMRAACFQAAKHDSLCEAHEGGRVASREAKRILAKAAAERASLAGAWSGESRSAMLGALSEVEWRRRWRGDGPAPWEDPAAAPPPDWSPWEVEAAKLAGTAMPRIKELRAIAAAPKWRAGDFAALGSGSGLALGMRASRAAWMLAGAGRAERDAFEAKTLEGAARFVAGALDSGAVEEARFERLAQLASRVGARALALSTPEGDAVARSACFAMLSSIERVQALAPDAKRRIIRDAAAPWVAAALAGSVAAADLSARIRAAAWASQAEGDASGTAKGAGPSPGEPKAPPAKGSALAWAGAKAGEALHALGAWRLAWLLGPGGPRMGAGAGRAMELGALDAALEASFALHGAQGESELRGKAGLGPPAGPPSLDLDPWLAAGALADACLRACGRGRQERLRAEGDLAKWARSCVGGAHEEFARSSLSKGGEAASASLDLDFQMEAASALRMMGGASLSDPASGVAARGALASICRAMKAMGRPQWGEVGARTSEWIEGGWGRLLSQAESEAIAAGAPARSESGRAGSASRL